MDFSGKVALVTGSGRGIGKAITLKLASAGAIMVVNDISLTNAQIVVDEIKGQGGDGLAVGADVSSAADVSRMVEAAIAAYGHIDILVNNAGITRDQLLLRMADSEWDDVLNIDLRSVFLCTRAVIKHMLKERKGRIVSIASIVGLMGNAGQANYAAAKAGIVGFTRSVAKEVASRGITANAVAPGFIETDMTAKLSEKQKQDLMSRIPLGYLGTPQDVAEVVAFLASDEARYITGQVITIDGGMGGA
ncbi:MAG: 3-oxoacyl-[acyl-carrier-protein] reductase [Dehalococcoidia bacterium]|nr:MAG: 3-oxoacyl-[acyl-carrier-protein] reductase [Dehalococcoidia bacterium]